jgi:DNA-binding beta-propeller fold protein YncE
MNNNAHFRLCRIHHLRLTSVVAAMFGVLVVIVGVLSPIVQAQTAQFSGSQSVLLTVSADRCALFGVVVDGAGNIYALCSGGPSPTTVLKESLLGSNYIESTIPTGILDSANGIALDANGDIYISGNCGNYGCDSNPSNSVVRESPSGSGYIESTVSATGLGLPSAITVDSSNNIYVADEEYGRILKETVSGGVYIQSVVIARGLDRPNAVAVDGSGNLFIGDWGSGRVLKETLSGGTYTESVVSSSGLLTDSHDLALDASGNIYVANGDDDNDEILKETPTNGTYAETTLISGLKMPEGVAIDGLGNLYVANSDNGQLLKEALAGVGFATANVATTGKHKP